MTDVADQELGHLLEYLKGSRGFDFTGYKRSTLERRITKRMDAVGVNTYSEYLDYLEVHPDEFSHLFDTVLINVTSFFRDDVAWDYMRSEVVPQLLSSNGGGPVRIWSAGCASGEEAFSVAMLLVEAMGEEDYTNRVKIYGTDVDEQALSQARSAIFTTKQMETVSEELRERCFDRTDQRFAFKSELRRTVIFGRNDLVQDAPISRVDLLVCRNTLMYFNAETQSQILKRFHFALKDTGYLFLGKSEMLLTYGELFRPTSIKWRIFTKVPRAEIRVASQKCCK